MLKINQNTERLVRIVCVIIVSFLFFLIPVEGDSSDIDSELIAAVKYENITLVKTLLEKGANLNAKGAFENTPLIIASKPGNTENHIIISAESGVTLSMTANPDPVRPGEHIFYTLTVSNAGLSPATNVVVTDSTPDHTQL